MINQIFSVKICPRCKKEHNTNHKKCQACRNYNNNYLKKWKEYHPEKMAMHKANWFQKYKENIYKRRLAYKKEWRRKARESLSTIGFVREIFNKNNRLNGEERIKGDEIPIEFFELYKANLQLKRMVRNGNQND